MKKNARYSFETGHFSEFENQAACFSFRSALSGTEITFMVPFLSATDINVIVLVTLACFSAIAGASCRLCTLVYTAHAFTLAPVCEVQFFQHLGMLI